MPDPSPSTPYVSVLVPAFNAARTLIDTLESVKRQTFSDFEAVIVDDGSRDATFDLAKEFAAHDPRFHVHRQDNAGVAAARNRALALSRGPLIAPLDADDLWHPEKLARQVDRARTTRAEAVLVYSWSVDIDEASTVISRRLDLDCFEGDVYAALVLTNFIGNASVPLIARDALLAVGGWDGSLRAQNAQGCEDWQLYLRLAELGDFALARGFLVGYRQSPGSMSRRVAEMGRSYELVLAEARARHPELPRALFRWSRGAYDIYRYETLYDSGTPLRSVAPLISGIARDPAWLMRRSTRKKVKSWLRRLFEAQSRRAPTAVLRTERFELASPDPTYEVSEGYPIDGRRRLVARMHTTRRSDGRRSSGDASLS